MLRITVKDGVDTITYKSVAKRDRNLVMSWKEMLPLYKGKLLCIAGVLSLLDMIQAKEKSIQ